MIVRPDPRASDHHHRDRGDGESPASHRFLTQRQSPSLATIEATEPVDITTTTTSSVDYDDGGGGGGRGGGRAGRAKKKTLIRLSSPSVPNSHHVYVDVHPSALRALPVRYRAGLWGDVVDVADVGDEAAAFVSEIVRGDDPNFADVRVVSLLPGITTRSVDGRYCPDAARVGYFGSLPHGGLTDGFPVSFVSAFQFFSQRAPISRVCRLRVRLMNSVRPVLSITRSSARRCSDFGRDASVAGRT